MSLSRALLLALPALLATATLAAQDARGRIGGRVVDPAGAPIPHATVEVTEAATQVKLTATTNDAGAYDVLYLEPGTYTVAVTAHGFKSFERTNLQVRVADRLTLDVTLPIGQVNESIVVSGQASLIDTASASLGQVTDKRRIVELPLPGGNSLTLAQFAPGVIYLDQPNHPSLGIGAIDQVSNIAVNGTRSGNVEFTVDGAPSMTGTTVSFSPPTEMVAEVKVQTATYDASTGRVPGGNVNIVLKTGASRFHGNIQWFHTDQHLEGLTLFSRQFLYDSSSGPVDDAKRALANPLNILNRYGATFSGPVVLPKLYNGRSRTFWAFSAEGLSRPQVILGNPITVPTAAERAGDFSALLKLGTNYQIYDPATIAAAGSGRFSRQVFSGNIIPANRLDKLAASFLPYWPLPNQAGTPDGINNYKPITTQANHQKNMVGKVDHNFNDKNRAFVRYNYASQLYIANPLVGTKTNVPDRLRYTDGAVLDDIHVISPALLNDFRVGFTRYEQSNTPELQGLDLTAAGFSPTLAAAIDPRARQFPNLSVAGYFGLGGAANNDAVSNYLTASDDLSWNKGPVLLRYGAEFRLYRSNNWALGGQNPTINFNQTWTNGPFDNSPAAPIGQGLASYLLGIPSGGSINLADSYADQSYNYAFYIQSDWRISRTLTLNAGLRYDYDGPVTERFNRSVRGFDFAVANPITAQALAKYAQSPIPEVPISQFHVNGGLTFAGINGQPHALWDSSHLNFAPRIGLAWQLDRNTAVRAGYGIFFLPQGVDRTAVNQNGFTAATTLTPSPDNGLHFVASLANPFPAGLNQPLGAQGGLSTGTGQAVTFFPTFMKSAYMQRFSAGVQRQLPARVFLDVSYVGNRGTRLSATRQYDPIPAQYLSTSPFRDAQAINFLTTQVANPFYPLLPGTGLSAANVARSQLLRPYPEFTGITASEPDGFSWYHSLQFTAERRFDRGVTVQFNWVWSKFMEATAFRNETDPVPAGVISDLDRTHVLHSTGIYELPLGRGKPLLSNAHGIGRGLVDGWQLQITWQHNSGAPLGFGDALLLSSDVALPADQRTIAHWFNTAAFDTKSADQLASNIVTLPTRFSGVRGPGMDIWNMSGVKNFFLSERARLQFRAEFLNAFNHTVLAAPNTTPTNSAFGSITAANASPRFIHFGLKLTF
jgi:outer membrane receptor protein involved in Fe transport